MLLYRQLITALISDSYKVCVLERARQSNETNVSLQLLLSEEPQATPPKDNHKSLYTP